MTELRDCPRCHNLLTVETQAGLCPNCLMQLALEDPTEKWGDRHNGSASPGLTLDSILGHDKIFGDYELLQEIARGGMGVIYRARQLSLNRIVAVKMMRPDLHVSEAELQRFRIEAEAAANLRHPNIVAIYEVGEHEGLHYFSMEYIEGQSLAELVHDHLLTAETAADYVRTIAEAIHYAHWRGILHRDLKPSNILIDQSDQLHVTDFGLAKRLASDSRLTATGAVLGTPSYMSPEQAAGKNTELSPASDVYSLGAILYELLTGRPPFQAASPLDTVLLVLKSKPVSPKVFSPQLSRDLETICLKCLEKDPAHRYQSALELAQDLGRYLNRQPIKARPIKIPERAWRWCRRNPWPTLATAALVLLATLASISAIKYRQRLWQSLLDQIRLERLAGNRAKSLEAAAEAARIKRTPELLQEAIQTITTPGVRLLQQFPYANHSKPIFSPDSQMIAFNSKFGDGNKEIKTTDFWGEPVVVREIRSGRVLATSETQHSSSAYLFNPPDPLDGQLSGSYSPLLALSKVMHRTVTRTMENGESRTESAGIEDQAVLLLNPMTGREFAEIRPPQSCPELIGGPLLFSPDGAYLVKGNDGSPIWVIDVHHRSSQLFFIEGAPVTFLSNRELLLNVDGRVRRWDMVTQESSFATPPGTVLMSLSGNGHVAILQPEPPDHPDSLSVWDVLSNRSIGSIPAYDKNKREILLSQDGRLAVIYSPSTPNMLQLWDLTIPGFRERIATIGVNTKIYFNQAAFSPDGSMLALFGIEGAMGSTWILETENGREVAVLRDNHSPAWSSNSRLLATAGPGTIKTGNNNSHSSSTSFDKNVSMGNSFLNVWEVTPPTPTYLLSNRINSLTFSPDSKQLVSNGTLWDVSKESATMPTRLTISNQKLPSNYAFFDRAGRLWATDIANLEFPIKLWQLSPEKREITFENPDYSAFKNLLSALTSEKIVAQPRDFALSPDGKSLVITCGLARESPSRSRSSGGDGTLEIWDLTTQKRLAIWNNENIRLGFSHVRFSPDGKRVATSGNTTQTNGFAIWDAATGKAICTLSQTIAGAIEFSPDSKLVFFGQQGFPDQTAAIFVYDAETGREVGVWKGHRGPISALAVSPDNRYLASGGQDRMIRLWDIRTGRELNRWEAAQSTVTALAFSPDGGSILASGSADGTLKLWNPLSINEQLKLLGLSIK